LGNLLERRIEAAFGSSAFGHRPVAPLKPKSTTDTKLKLGNLQLDPLALRVSVNGRIVPATVLEFRLLEYMARNPGQVFTRDQLLDAVWGKECFITPRTVDACVRRIRTKIESAHGRRSLLKTIRGVGYSLGNVSPSSRNPRR
jgi:DNA-binding response OmpR family regulator